MCPRCYNCSLIISNKCRTYLYLNKLPLIIKVQQLFILVKHWYLYGIVCRHVLPTLCNAIQILCVHKYCVTDVGEKTGLEPNPLSKLLLLECSFRWASTIICNTFHNGIYSVVFLLCLYKLHSSIRNVSLHKPVLCPNIYV